MTEQPSVTPSAQLVSPRSPASKAPLLVLAAAFGCGTSSAFGIELLGQLYWAELLLPLLAAGMVIVHPPRELFANRSFRLLMGGIALMFVGYVVSDLAARTPSEMYLRGWARVVVLGTSAFSLCVLCVRDRRCLWWFAVGMGIGGIAANIVAGVPLIQWKLGYGEPVASLAAASGGVLPLWIASLVILGMGAATILFDYRSLGVQLMLVAAATMFRSRHTGERRSRMKIPMLVLGFGLAAAGALYLLNESQSENFARRQVSNIGRIAALRIGVQAIADSPIIGFGSWGQGTQKYADMLYNNTLGDLLSLVNDDVVGDPSRGSYFSAHSQVVQAWMEGGILAGAFFLTYIVLLTKSMYQLLFRRKSDQLTPILLLIGGANLWASVMSPFLGNQRIAVALSIAAIVMISLEGTSEPGVAPSQDRLPAARRPSNLMA